MDIQQKGPFSQTFWILVWVLVLFAASGCEGQGGEDGLIIETRLIADNCTPPPSLSPFPSGLALLSGELGLATMVQLAPNGLVVYDLEANRPRIVAVREFSLDSDMDGIEDRTRSEGLIPFPQNPLPGEIQAIDDSLALVSTSFYEQVLVADPRTGEPRSVTVDVPAAIPAGRYPVLPAPGTSAQRTGLSTFLCVEPASPFDSAGIEIDADPACSAPGTPSYLTNLTAGKAVAGGRLFIAMSNLRRNSRYYPGTILVFDWIENAGDITIRPSVEMPFLAPSGFNPTGMKTIQTPGGRELVLATISGAVAAGSGASTVETDSSIDVIDPSVPRIVATVPLGRAGPSFDAPAVDPSGRFALVGASSDRSIFGLDLRPLDDPALYLGSGPPVVLDGMTLGFPDARIFTADFPFTLPRRTDGRRSMACEGFTDVTLNTAGSFAFVSDFCDGTITRIAIEIADSPPIPIPRDRFVVTAQDNAFSPNDVFGLLSAPSLIVARPGIPGIDFRTPDVVAVAGQPDGQICSFRIESL